MGVQSEKLMSDVTTAVTDIEAMAKIGGSGTVQRMSSNLAVLRDKVVAAEHVLEDKAKAGAKAVDGYVHENPWKSIGIAAGAGLLIGMLIKRKL